MRSNPVSTMHAVKNEPHKDLFVFGYSSKIFLDDEKALYIDQGKHLIPWMGDETLMIDRYDVRGYLQDLKQYEANPESYSESSFSEEEKLCEEERYRSLRFDVAEEQLCQEEELKRLYAAIAGDKAYNEVCFSYDNEVEKLDEPVSPNAEVEEFICEPYEPPPELKIPEQMVVPSNMKIHTIIEKTALFVKDQGGQMEVIIKMKQDANPQFAFMQLENPLYPYYKFLVEEIKSGSYKPIQEKIVCQDEDEDYLHPSLLSGKTEIVPEFTVPSIKFCHNEDNSYSVLVKNVQQQLEEENAAKKENESIEENSIREENDHTPEKVQRNQHLVDYSLNDSCTSEHNSSTVSFIVPPSYTQAVIQKMVEYVIKYGEDFENAVKCKSDKRLEFLNPSNEYHSYYIHLQDKVKHQLAIPDIVAEFVPTVATEQSVTPEIKSPNHPLEINVLQTEIYVAPSENLLDQETVTQSTVGKYSSLYSQDVVIGTKRQFSEVLPEEQCNSLDTVDSNSVCKEVKSIKVPISSTVKVKESDIVPEERLKSPLLLNNCNEGIYNERSREKWEILTEKKIDKKQVSSQHDNVKEKKKPKSSQYHSTHLQEKVKHHLAIPDTVAEFVPAVATEQSVTPEIKSPNHPLEINVLQTEISVAPSENLLDPETVTLSTVGKYSSYSQDVVIGTKHQFSEVLPEEQCNSLDSVDSNSVCKEVKSLKVPISSTVKVKESDIVPEERLKIPLLLNNCNEGIYDERSREKCETLTKKKIDKKHASSKHDNVKEKKKPKSSQYHSTYLQDEVKHQFAIPDIVAEFVPAVATGQSVTSGIKSPNHRPEKNAIQTEISNTPSENHLEQEAVIKPTVDEYNSLCSQNIVFSTEHQLSEMLPEGHCNPLDFVDPNFVPKNMNSLKDPINFSSKVNSSGIVRAEKLKIPLDDSSEKSENHKMEKTDEKHRSALNYKQDNVKKEENLKLDSEMEAKLAEDRLRNELLSTAREKIAQRKKKQLQMEQKIKEEQLKIEKQQQIDQHMKELQLKFERKRKAAVFLKMLKKEGAGDTDTLPARLSSNNKKLKSERSKQDLGNISGTSKTISKKNGIFPVPKQLDLQRTLPQIKNGWSSSSTTASEESVKHKHKKRMRSRSRSRERYSESSRRDRSRSPRRYRHEQSRKEKELRTSYASASRSRYHSPRHHR